MGPLPTCLPGRGCFVLKLRCPHRLSFLKALPFLPWYLYLMQSSTRLSKLVIFPPWRQPQTVTLWNFCKSFTDTANVECRADTSLGVQAWCSCVSLSFHQPLWLKQGRASPPCTLICPFGTSWSSLPGLEPCRGRDEF